MSYHIQVEQADDRAYYSRRAAEEAGRAETAITPAAKQAHADLAAIFTRKAAQQLRSPAEPVAQGPIQIL